MARRWFLDREKADELEQKLNQADSLQEVKSVVNSLIHELRWTELSDIETPEHDTY